MSRDFWSRRREAVAAEAEAEARAADISQANQDQAGLDAKTDEEILSQYDLPDPDALETPDAVKDFLSYGLPQRLKTRALRRLWRLNPVLANVDGLVDYGEDYTDAATVIDGLQTAYQVGKGMLAHVEAQTKEAAPATDTEAVCDEADAENVMAETECAPDASVHEASEPALALASPEEDSLAPPSLNRRMTFQFESVT